MLVEVNGTAITGAMSTHAGVRMRLFPRKQAGPGQRLPVKNMTTYFLREMHLVVYPFIYVTTRTISAIGLSII